MIELLKRWSELEPDRCMTIDGGTPDYYWRIQVNEARSVKDRDLDWTFSPKKAWRLDLLVLLGSTLIAIAARPTLRYRLQNSEGGTHASIRDIEDETIAFDAVDGEAAIALLTVYLQWLELKQEPKSL